ncbi:MAG: molecular chaperone Hsp90 [Thomasclavelia sp.]|jgi:hypothetical protein|nr:molecular chaperone Hsp90 [Thomasclavelia sp.]
MNKDTLIQTIKDLMNEELCCKDLKESCKSYLESLNTPSQKDEASKLIKELKEDIMEIDPLITFLSSSKAKEIIGDEVEGLLAHAKDIKVTGGKYCDCPACSKALIILENQNLL